ncbi:MAG TPA: hypothetical protein VLA41_12725 [Burkholderiales bacterium]|nr:hypothetical protein [Burkholderiales bacterium]
MTERSLGHGLLRCTAGVILFAGAALFAAPLWFGVPTQLSPPAAVPLVLGAAGLALLLWGLDALLRRTQMTLERDGVTFERRGLRGAQAWSEPLDAYRGVLASCEARRGGVDYTIVLKHAKDATRDAVLERWPSPAGQRARLAGWAKLLGLPALAAAARGLEARAPSDIGKPLATLTAEGKFTPPAAPAEVPAAGTVRSLPRAEGYAFRSWRGGAAIALGVAGIAIGLVELAVLGDVDAEAAGLATRIAAYGRLVVLPLGVALLALGARLGETLEVDPTGVRACLLLGQGVLRETLIAADAVDQVRADPRLGVHIVADEGAVRFARGAPEAVLRLIANAVLATVARGTEDVGAAQIGRLRKFATAGFAAGLGPDQVHAKLSELGAPVEDVEACLRAIAEDRTLPYAGLMRAYLKLGRLATARPAAIVLALPPIVPPGVARAAVDTVGLGGPLRAAAVGGALLFLVWLAVPLFERGAQFVAPWVPTAARAALHDATRAEGEADYRTAGRIAQGYAGFEVPAAQGTRYILFGAEQVSAEVQGRHLRVVVKNLRLEKKSDVQRADYAAVGIVVAPLDARRPDHWAPAYDFNVGGTLSAEAPVATLAEQAFIVPTMADACAGGCLARLLLQVRTEAAAPFTENSPVFRLAPGAAKPTS